MLKNLTFSEQFDKITYMYVAGQIRPLDPCACFVGTILNGTNKWAVMKEYNQRLQRSVPVADGLMDPEYSFYTMEEILALEQNFLAKSFEFYEDGMQVTEDSLFRAVKSTLDILQGIHDAKGEVISHIQVKHRQPVS
jgi:hypothetical protein